jgi:hypothetical protein
MPYRQPACRRCDRTKIVQDTAFPELALVRVLSAGGPYEPDQILSLAFSEPRLGRLLRHEAPVDEAAATCGSAPVPESISARVVTRAGPYAAGDFLTLSFVDPRFVRIHPAPAESDRVVEGIRDDAPVIASARAFAPTAVPASVRTPVTVAVRDLEATPTAPSGALEASPSALSPRHAARGIRVRLSWEPERARRFVGVVDKLFTVDRLGWYRHVFAMRLLVPDEIACGDEAANPGATGHLQMLRAATTETLGRPLLAAFMPNFSVSPEWLETIDTPAVARALADLRGAVLPFADDVARIEAAELADGFSVGALTRHELVDTGQASADAFLATLVPSHSPNALLEQHLEGYRSALCDVFAQTARSVEAVRLGRMSETNHALDDRLWQLVGAVGATLDALAVA